MSPETNYTALLQHLEQQRDEIDTAIRTIRKVLGQTAAVQPQAPLKGEIVVISKAPKSVVESPEPKIKPGMFTGMQVWKAALKYLQLTKKPQNTRQMAQALMQGGLGTNAKKFDANLHQAMAIKPHVFKKVDVGMWGLTDWAP